MADAKTVLRPVPAWKYILVRAAFRAFLKLNGGLRVLGRENIPMTGPLIIAPNHLSDLDPPAMAASTDRQMRAMAKQELFSTLAGKILYQVGVFPVKRGEADSESVRYALAALEAGEALLLFPEGTRGEGQQLLPFNRGVVMMAKRSRATVIPVAIVGSHLSLPKGGKWRRHRITVIYGKPFSYAEVAQGATEQENRQLFTERLAHDIVALCAAHGLPMQLPPDVSASPSPLRGEGVGG